MYTEYVIENSIKHSVIINQDTGEIVRDELGTLLPAYNEYYITYYSESATDHYRKYKYIMPTELDSVQKLNSFLELFDKRTLVLQNNLKGIFDSAAGSALRSGSKSMLSAKQYHILNTVISNLSYRNFLICKTKDMATLLGVEQKNVKAKLKTCSGYLTLGECKHGEIKVYVNPVYGYKHFSATINLSRLSAIKDWQTFFHSMSVKPKPTECDYTYKGKDSYMESFKDMLDTPVCKVYDDGSVKTFHEVCGQMDEIEYFAEFGKWRHEEWPDVENDSHLYLPEHLTQAGQKKKYSISKFNIV